jgi:uncharacterized membrane protein YvbJ
MKNSILAIVLTVIILMLVKVFIPEPPNLSPEETVNNWITALHANDINQLEVLMDKKSEMVQQFLNDTELIEYVKNNQISLSDVKLIEETEHEATVGFISNVAYEDQDPYKVNLIAHLKKKDYYWYIYNIDSH